MKEISAHELSERRQQEMVQREVESRRCPEDRMHELLFDKETVRESMRRSRIERTTPVRTITPP